MNLWDSCVLNSNKIITEFLSMDISIPYNWYSSHLYLYNCVYFNTVTRMSVQTSLTCIVQTVFNSHSLATWRWVVCCNWRSGWRGKQGCRVSVAVSQTQIYDIVACDLACWATGACWQQHLLSSLLGPEKTINQFFSADSWQSVCSYD